MAFGTGAVKVTPAHDFNDFATGKRHGLPELNILSLDGRMNAECGEFTGLDRFEARRRVKERLAELGLERGSRPHQMTLPRSQRSGSIVEPMISTQWFVKMQPLAEPALAAVREGRTQIIPRSGPGPTSTGSPTSKIGASRVSSGGVTRSPPSSARTAVTSW
jgi:valyl-tRNA synthetase